MKKLYLEYCKTYNLTKDNSDGFFETVSDVYFSEEVQSLVQYEQHLDINRLQHITSVAYLSYKICKKLNLDYKAAARAATMHDLFYYDWRDGENGKWHCLHGYKHPKYAVLNAKELCKDVSSHELDIIKNHMWPLTLAFPSTIEGLVVCFADKYSATREMLYSTNKKYKNRFLSDIGKINK
ncbi:MAG: HD domain-containing protein [Clostridia bacterium]|nr:HD domain-containing protein [Clostridia bacterium]